MNQLNLNTNDKLNKVILQNANITTTIITLTDTLNELKKRHELGKLETQALSEAVVGAILLSSNLKQGEKLSLSIKTNGLIRQALVDINLYFITDTDAITTVRGFISTQELTKEPNLNLGIWQTGIITTAKLLLHEKEPYIGAIELITGNLAQDLTFYLSQSEQIPSAIGISVELNDEGFVKKAGGFLIQIIAGAKDEEIELIEKNLKKINNLTKIFANQNSEEELLKQIFEENFKNILHIQERKICFYCNCSKQRVENALKLMQKEELISMIEEDKGAEVYCDFCREKYTFTKIELETILKEK